MIALIKKGKEKKIVCICVIVFFRVHLGGKKRVRGGEIDFDGEKRGKK